MSNATAKGGVGTPPPHRNARDVVADRAVYAAVRVVIQVFRTLPAPLARWLGRQLGEWAWRVLRRKRREMLRHMDLAFREEFSRAQKEIWVRKHFEHLGLFVAEFSRLSLLTPDNVDALCDLSEIKVFEEWLAKLPGKGLLAVPAHHGNWELCGFAVALKGYALKSVARPLDNPFVNELVDGIRERSGNEIVHKYQVLWKLKKMLDHGAIVTMSVDQNGGTSGLFVPLFGVSASTVASPADLHLASGVPIMVASLNRQADGVRHKFHVWDVIECHKSAHHEADRMAVLTRINRAYEKAIRAYPEQWLWGHRRWRTRPPGEVLEPDGLPPRAGVEKR